jgi:methylthioribose-1-phosphate isomerase
MIDAVRYNSSSQTLELLDQTLLPVKVSMAECHTEQQVAHAIVSMQVRGAPAIGVAAAYGIVIGLQNPQNHQNDFNYVFNSVCNLLAATRPTAVNLFWAIEG